MAAAGSGAVFFLGTRAHYQVLQQPETQFDVENGNTSTETIYQNPSTMWDKERQPNNYINGGPYCNGGPVLEENNSNAKKRNKRRPSETALCEDKAPAAAALNYDDNGTPKRQRRIPLLAFFSSLSRRKKKPGSCQLHQLDSSLLKCTYRESCRCLECQSRYFECDDYEMDYSSEDDSEYLYYAAQAQQPPPLPPPESDDDGDDNDDDEVSEEKEPGDNTSTDQLIDTKNMSVSSAGTEQEEAMNLEVVAGTPVLLNYLLTHPVTCVLQ